MTNYYHKLRGVDVGSDYDLYNVESMRIILGNDYPVAKIKEFSKEVNTRASKRAPLLYSGLWYRKKRASSSTCKGNGWNVVELNASDYRDKETIENRLISAATSKPF